jgi:ribulose-5-phosphate 4-epimerase/fuculose-1-phosphate aldolase
MTTRMAQSSNLQNSNVRQLVSAEEWKVRVELAALYRWVNRLGWDDHIFTHISARVPAATDQFLLNPLGSLFDEITASSLVKVDLAGKKLMETDSKVNWGGVTIHAPVYEAKKEAACVIHLHTTAAVAVSAQEHGLLPLSQFAILLYGKIAYHDYTGLEATDEDRRNLLADLGDKKIMILRNHGTLVWGKSFAEAFNLCLWLERACAAQIAALSGGAKLVLPSDEVAALTVKQNEEYGSPDLAWEAVIRRLDALDPSYRDRWMF